MEGESFVNNNQPEITNTWADFAVKHLQPSVLLNRFDDKKGRRFYWWVSNIDPLEIKTSVGITSILSQVMPTPYELVEWKLRTPNWADILRNSADYGTLMHIINRHWLVSRTVPKELLDSAREICVAGGQSHDMPERDLLAFMQFCNDYNVKPLIIEGMLLSPDLNGEHFCQTIDALVELDDNETTIEVVPDGVYIRGDKKGQEKTKEVKITTKVRKIAILDHKSNYLEKITKKFYDTNLFQLIAGKRAVEYNLNVKVDLVANYGPNAWKKEPSYAFKTWEIKKEDEELFDLYIIIAQKRKLFTPVGKIFVYPDFNVSTQPSDYRVLSYEEYVKDYLLNPVVEERTEVTYARTADSRYYDGKKLIAALLDESGKTLSTNILERPKKKRGRPKKT